MPLSNVDGVEGGDEIEAFALAEGADVAHLEDPITPDGSSSKGLPVVATSRPAMSVPEAVTTGSGTRPAR